MVQINVEKYTPTLFRKWSDGPKYVLVATLHDHTLDTEFIHAVEVLHPANVEKWFEGICFNKAGTFYLIADLEVVCGLVEKRPDLDIRMLLV